MVQFGGILIKRSKLLATICALCAVTSLTSCGVYAPNSITDVIRPELNQDQLLRVDPGTVVVDFTDTAMTNQGQSGTDITTAGDILDNGNSPEDTDTPTTGTGVPVSGTGSSAVNPDPANNYVIGSKMYVDPRNFGALPNTMVSCDSYADYLRTEVYEPLKELIEEIPSENRKGIYLRVMHAGYNPVKDSPRIEKGNGYDAKVSYGITDISGVSLGAYAMEWVGKFAYNATLIDNCRRATMNLIQDDIDKITPPTEGVLWDDTDWLAASGVNDFSRSILAMWGNERFNYSTLKDYRNNLERQTIGVVPNLRLQIFQSATNMRTLTLNRASGRAGQTPKRYVDYMTQSDVNIIFTKYNQFANRTTNTFEKTYTDDGSMLYSYTDGYTRTLVLVATAPGENIHERLGNKNSEVSNIVYGVLAPTKWQDIEAKMPGISTISAGAKGAD